MKRIKVFIEIPFISVGLSTETVYEKHITSCMVSFIKKNSDKYQQIHIKKQAYINCYNYSTIIINSKIIIS